MKYELTAKRLREAMDDSGMTAQELSVKADVNKASISQYVNGSHTPGNIKAYKIGKVLDVDPQWLMGFDVPKKQIEYKNPEQELYEAAFKLYYSYLASDKKTRNIIDQLLERDE